jgi:hypothetical protein
MSLYIVLEKKVPGFEPIIDGKALGRFEKELAEIAERCGVQPLMSFFSTNVDDASEFLQNEGLADVEVPEEQWFPPQDGLRTVEALLREIANVPELADVRTDLLAFQNVLRRALERGIRWHLAIDF